MSQFTSPEHARQSLQERLDYTANKMRNLICANAKLIVTPATIDEKTKSVHPGDIQYDDNHCKNDRRNGSKYCQACSDAYHNKQS